MDTPFFNKTKQLAALRTRFFVPGHKGNKAAIPRFGEWLAYDLTEIEGADDLSHPSDTLAQSQQNMSKAYGSGATLYSASGSTSCIQAMLTLFVPSGHTVVMARGCHVSAIRALAFIDAHPIWVLPQISTGQPSPPDIEAALKNSNAKAVYLTSPNYEGQIADIPAISAICRQYNAVLLVDNAHGAHLRFLPQNLHPLSLGADACADSAHKTLPCLTPAALLHLRDASLAQSARQTLNLYSSTSPSYPVLQSLDWAAGLLLTNPPSFAHAAQQLADVAQSIPHLVQPSDDPLKLCLKPALGGWQALQVNHALEAAGIFAELADSERIILMASPYNTPQDFALLAKALQPFYPKAPLAVDATQPPLPPQVCSIRQAVFGAKVALPVNESAGRVCAGMHAPCPPGVPLVLPGELILPQTSLAMQSGGILQVDVLK